MVNREDVIKRYENGDTLSSIAADQGVSRQRIWQILKPYYPSLRTEFRQLPRAAQYHPKPEEAYVFDKIKKNLKPKEIKHMDYNSPFDILVDGKRIEVKYASKPQLESGLHYYRFNSLSSKTYIDYYVFVCGDLHKNPTNYIIPSSDIGRHKSIPAIPKSRTKLQRLYREKWSMIAY